MRCFGVRLCLAPSLLGLAIGLSGCATSSSSVLKQRASNPWARLLYPAPAEHWDQVTKVNVKFTPGWLNGSRARKSQQLTVPFYDSGGPKPVVLLLHGTPGGHESWARLATAAELTNLVRVVTLDLPGHGLAERAVEPMSFEGLAQFVAAFMETLAISNATVVGQSYGGEVAWRLATGQSRSRVDKLVLIDALAFPRSREQLTKAERRVLGFSAWIATTFALKPPRRDTKAGLQEVWETANWASLEPSGLVDLYDGFVSRRGNLGVWRQLLNEELTRSDQADVATRLSSLRQPTLLIWGMDDALSSLEGQANRFLEHLPNARLVLLERAGHSPHEERPDKTAETIARWFKGELPNAADGNPLRLP